MIERNVVVRTHTRLNEEQLPKELRLHRAVGGGAHLGSQASMKSSSRRSCDLEGEK
ncbi:hypothetical protein SAMN05444695_1061 [Rhodococcus triatomae]|uniref:Uncharacterized protein n=1 Tax=Rhodococcus triatomae TaxID=300028 RepID=A0A1G8IXU9_9NOCA|nr:hypothetical protein SAMN05444695_1061 [Rhodococcus triatomae]